MRCAAVAFITMSSIRRWGREIEIVKLSLPEAETRLIEEAVAFVHKLRKEDLHKVPGIAETLD